MMRVMTFQIINMQGHQGMIDKALEEFMNQIDIKLANRSARKFAAKLQAWAAWQVKHYTAKRLIKRYISVTITINALFYRPAPSGKPDLT